MKKVLLFTLTVFLLSETYAINDKIRLGFVASPGFGWFAPKGNDLKKGTVQYAMNYGVVVDYYFKDQNYGIQSGLFGGIDKGQLSDRALFTTNTGSIVKETYNNQYLAIPLYLKLKTNSIKNFHIFGQVGFTNVFTISSRVTFDHPLKDGAGADIPVVKESIMKKGNAVNLVINNFKSNVYDFRISAGAGFEYDVTEKIAVTFGVFYHNGFVNTLADQDAKKDPVLVRNLLFSAGVMF